MSTDASYTQMVNLLLQQLNTSTFPLTTTTTATRASVTSASRPSPSIPPSCPGLTSVYDAQYKWIVPYGSTATERTYCERCAAKYHIGGTPYRSQGGTNCDGFLKANLADNGVFNVSFWDHSLRNFFHTTCDDGVYYVSMPSGASFSTLLHSSNPKNQAFRYELEVLTSSDRTYFLSKDKTYYVDSCLIGTNRDTATNMQLKMNYVDSDQQGWNLIDDAELIKTHHIVRPGDTLIIKFHIYDTAVHNCYNCTNHDLGSYTLASDNRIVLKSSTTTDKLQNQYNTEAVSMMPSQEFKKFTTKPMVMKFIFTTDTTVADTSSILLDKVIAKMIDRTTKSLSKATHEARLAKEAEMSAVAARLAQDATVATLREKLAGYTELVDPESTESSEISEGPESPTGSGTISTV